MSSSSVGGVTSTEATAAQALQEMQIQIQLPASSSTSSPGEVLKRTSLELPTYSRASSSKFSRYATSSKSLSDSPSGNGNMLDAADANHLSDEEIRPLMPSSSSSDSNSAVEVVLEQPAEMSIFAVSYRTGRSKEKRDKQTETDFSGLGDFLVWVWGGSRYSGIICMALSSFIYGIMGLLVELFAAITSIPSSETIFIRCAVILVAAFIWIRKTGQSLFGLPNVRRFLIARAVAGYLSLLGFFYSIQVLPLRDAIVLNFTTPFMAAILGRFILQEKWGVKELGGTVCSFLGVFLIFYPIPLLQGRTSERDASTSKYMPGGEHYMYAILIALLSAACGGANYCFIRAAGKTSEQPVITVFAFAAFACPIAAICMFSFQKFVVPDLFAFIAMIIVALLAFVAEVLLARGLHLEKAFRATSILYIEAFASYILRIMFLEQIPSILGLSGALAIVLSTMTIAYFGREKIMES